MKYLAPLALMFLLLVPVAPLAADHVVKRDIATVVVSVQNTGETVAREHLPRLFDRFYRVHPSRQRFGEGAGLGLAITRSIAHAHGGEAMAHSEDGFTTFEIRLPV